MTRTALRRGAIELDSGNLTLARLERDQGPFGYPAIVEPLLRINELVSLAKHNLSPLASEFPAVIDLSELDPSDGFIVQGDTAGDIAGSSVAAAGDVNRDGLDDILIGASRANDGGADSGAAYVIFGRTSGFGFLDPITGRNVIDLASLDVSDGFVIQGDAPGDSAGDAVSSAGDINGDGFSDIIVGASSGDDGGADAGEAYVIFGSASGFGAFNSETNRNVLDLTTLSPTDGFLIRGDYAGVRTGFSVSSAGDLNGDGFDDLVVGAPFGQDNEYFSTGEAYVVFGRASGFGELDSTGRNTIDATTLDPSNGFVIQGDSGGDLTGERLAGAGDVNGDGFADLILGASRGDDGGTDAGEAYVIFGKASGFGELDPITDRNVVDLTTLLPTDGFIIRGDSADDRAGFSVSSAGDVNGDGFIDMMVGARYGDDGANGAGEAYVVFGRESGFGSLDPSTNRNVIDLTTLSTADGFVIQGDAVGDLTGFSLSSAGDINGDGFADIIVGASHAEAGLSNVGQAYVIFGRSSGFGELDPGTNRNVIDVAALGPDDGFLIRGDADRDYAGFSVSSAGDVNGDGFADLMVGARGGDDGGADAGEVYLIFGLAPTTAVERTGSDAGQTIRGGAFDDTLRGLIGDDTLGGGDGADSLAGGSGDDWADYSNAATKVRADLGAPESNTGDAAGDIYTSIENLRGSLSKDKLFGDDQANRIEGLAKNDKITGGDGKDTLVGGSGRDTLEGGEGRDDFELASRLFTDADKILDFAPGEDRIALDGPVFDLGEGKLKNSSFVIGTAAGDASDRLIYDDATGKLFFDADGTGAEAQVLIATLSDAPVIGAGDFVVI